MNDQELKIDGHLTFPKEEKVTPDMQNNVDWCCEAINYYVAHIATYYEFSEFFDRPSSAFPFEWWSVEIELDDNF